MEMWVPGTGLIDSTFVKHQLCEGVRKDEEALAPPLKDLVLWGSELTKEPHPQPRVPLPE